ncbi:MAG: beta-hydroxyacyl-ACP dehydratase [Cyanobacteria bacterium NC_groundwater_1444_Ag_S-0.65um_54_12]|nr:beta-hydroxyacyl-ACP dehydratase [Cyanobacteria bacterium NC_groundwater_1444_Ag_S-0.65um_54_12]
MRYFLVDRVTELAVGQWVRGVKNVTLSDEILHDHFPDYPVMPGALIVEAAAQLAGFLIEMTFNQLDVLPQRALLAQIQQAKFNGTCGPGDRIDLYVALGSKLGSAVQVRAEAQVEGRRVMRAQLTFVLKEIDSERVHEQRRYLYSLWTKDLQTRPAIR